MEQKAKRPIGQGESEEKIERKCPDQGSAILLLSPKGVSIALAPASLHCSILLMISLIVFEKLGACLPKSLSILAFQICHAINRIMVLIPLLCCIRRADNVRCHLDGADARLARSIAATWSSLPGRQLLARCVARKNSTR